MSDTSSETASGASITASGASITASGASKSCIVANVSTGESMAFTGTIDLMSVRSMMTSVNNVRLMDDDRRSVVHRRWRRDVHGWYMVSGVDDWNWGTDVNSWDVGSHVNRWHVRGNVNVRNVGSNVYSRYVRSNVYWWVMRSNVDRWRMWSNVYAGWEWMPSVVLSFLSGIFFVIVSVFRLTFNGSLGLLFWLLDV